MANEATNGDEDVKKVIDYCAKFLAGPWNTVCPEQIQVKKFSAGFANSNFYCSLPQEVQVNSECPREVVVHLYGSSFTNGDYNQKYNGEAGEVVLCEILSQLGLGPKLYGVFNGGRIEEYIPSRTATPKDLQSIEANCCVAHKLAKWHTLRMPISKIPNRIQATMKQFSRLTDLSQVVEGAEPEFKELLQFIHEFPLLQEMEWFLKIVPLLGDRVVFCHTDLYLGNLLIRKEDKVPDDDSFVLIDYEMCGYFYQCYDLANFLEYRKWSVETSDDLKISLVSEDNEPEIRKRFIQAYLEEWQRLSGDYNPEEDCFEKLEMRIAFMELLVDLINVGTLKLGLLSLPVEQLVKHLHHICSGYFSKKDHVLKSYGKQLIRVPKTTAV